jgi:chromosome segregation ATPase
MAPKIEKTEELDNALKENRHLKETIAAMREELESLDFVRQKAVQDAVLESQAEIEHLRTTIVAQREELESIRFETEKRFQETIAELNSENKQLKDAIQELRSELEQRAVRE